MGMSDAFEIDFNHDTNQEKNIKLKNSINRVLIDLTIIRNNGKPFFMDSDLIELSQRLTQSIIQTKKKADARNESNNFKRID